MLVIVRVTVNIPAHTCYLPSEGHGMSESGCLRCCLMILASTSVLPQCKLAAALAAMIECCHSLCVEPNAINSKGYGLYSGPYVVHTE